MNPANLNPKYTVPTVSSDGFFININESDSPSLSFFQLRKQTANNVEVDVVASVRLNNLDELENLQSLISDTIKQHKNREK